MRYRGELMRKVNLEIKLSQFSEYLAPRTNDQFNRHDIMAVKSNGEYVWHSHSDTDECFLTSKVILQSELRDRTAEAVKQASRDSLMTGRLVNDASRPLAGALILINRASVKIASGVQTSAAVGDGDFKATALGPSSPST
jgi:hypothetical protein